VDQGFVHQLHAGEGKNKNFNVANCRNPVHCFFVMELVIAFGVGAVIGGVVSYFFFRANPKKKAAVDKWVDENKV